MSETPMDVETARDVIRNTGMLLADRIALTEGEVRLRDQAFAALSRIQHPSGVVTQAMNAIDEVLSAQPEAEDDLVLVALPKTALRALRDRWERGDDTELRALAVMLIRDVFGGQDGYLTRLTDIDL